MCGISAVLETDQSHPPHGMALQRMHELQRHRGPDGEAFLGVDAQLCAVRGPSAQALTKEAPLLFTAGFHWLRIVDLDTASMPPLHSPDGLLWILLNGEIYNFRDLRAELGHSFRTNSDTEVALLAYERWGTECFQRFRGMWAMLVIDLKRGVVVGSRDRLGIKPLYYSWDGTRLLLASEPKAVASARRDGVQPNTSAVGRFLRGLPPDEPTATFFQGAKAVPAGTHFTLRLRGESAGRIEFRSYWDLDVAVEDHPLPFPAACEEFESLLCDSLHDHLNAAVPVGALLSGGLDSSLLISLAAARLCRDDTSNPKALSVIYESPALSEWPYIQLVLAKHRLKGASLLLQPELAWQSAPEVVRAMGQPLLGQDVIAQYHAYRLAREEGRTVVLDGQGADELLGGLPLYESEYLLALAQKARFVPLVRELRARSLKYGMNMLKSARTAIMPSLRRRVTSLLRRNNYDWIEAASDPADPQGRGPNGWRSAQPLTAYLYRLVRQTNLPTVLQQQDRSSMAHAIESRVPYLDHRIVEFCFRLPDSYKIRLADRKKVLLETARKYLPDALIERKDKRAFISQPRWIDLKKHSDALRALAASATIHSSTLLHGKRTERFIEDFLRGRHDDSKAIWRIYTAAAWMDAFRLA